MLNVYLFTLSYSYISENAGGNVAKSYRKSMPNNPTKNPRINPDATSANEWRLNTIRLEPTMPAMIMVTHSHHTGLKLKMKLKAIKAPFIAPAAAEWVLTLCQLLHIKHANCTKMAVSTTLITNLGTTNDDIR